MKNDVILYVSQCLKCQQVKAENLHPATLLYPHNVPEYKWQVISMDFIQGIPMSQNKYDVILVVVDKLTIVAHFIIGNLTNNSPILANKFVQEVFWLHGVLEVIISDNDSRITSIFWQTLYASLGTKLNISSDYHPETNGQTEKVNQVLEDLLRMYCMDQHYKWEEYLPLVEFSYNNTFHYSIQMVP